MPTEHFTDEDYALAHTLRNNFGTYKAARHAAHVYAEIANTLRSFRPNFDTRQFVKQCKPTWLPGTRSEAAFDNEAARVLANGDAAYERMTH